MENKKKLNLLLIGVILVVIQSFLQQYDTFNEIYSKYVGYFVPVIYAFFITVFLEPIVSFIEKKLKLKRLTAVILTVMFVILLVAGFVGIVVPQISRSIKELYNKLPYMQIQIEKYTTELIEYLKEKDILVMGEVELQQNIANLIRKNLKYIQDFGISALWNVMWWIVALTKFFIGFFLAFLILIDKEYFIRFLRNIFIIFLGREKSESLMGDLEQSRKILLNYVWGRIIVSSAVGIVTLLIMLISGTPYAILSGIMIGFGNMIPYIGSIIAGAIAIFLVALADPFKLIFLIIAMIIAQTVDGWIIGPKIVSETVGMGTFWVVVSVLIGGSLFGPVGMFFGVPAFGIIKLIYRRTLEKKENKK